MLHNMDNIPITINIYELEIIVAKMRQAIRGINAHADLLALRGRDLSPNQAKRVADFSRLISKLEAARASALITKKD